MIKINFASRKQSVVTGEVSASKFTMGGLLDGVDVSQLKALPIRKAGAAVLIGIIASYVLETYKQEELDQLQNASVKLSAEEERLKKSLEKIKSYEEIKKTLDEDEAVIRTKLETIQKLLTTRDRATKVLVGVATTIPEEVWLRDLKFEKSTDLTMIGSASDINHITDFMKNLNESAVFVDVEMKNTKQVKESETNQEIAVFELTAKRR